MLLSGCLASDKLATFGAGDGKLAVELPIACEAFLQQVPVPAVTGKTNAQVAYARTADALDEANDRLGAGGSCARDQHQIYSGKETSQP